MIPLYLLIGGLLYIAFCMVFDDFISYQYRHFREDWVVDGKPRGFRFNPEGSSYLGMTLFSFRGYKEPPQWALPDQIAVKKHRRLAGLYGAWKWYLILLLPVILVSTSI